MGQLAGQQVIVAGASSGMGRATSLRLAEAGADVALIARSADKLEAVAGAIRAMGRRALPIVADLTDGAAARAAIAMVIERWGRVDTLIYVAGTNIPRRALTVLEAADWSNLLETNVSGAFHVTQAVLPAMRQQGGGLIIYVSSYAVQRPDGSGVAYQASKHAMTGLAHGTREEEKANGIRTTVIYPGLTNTPLVEKRPVPTPPEVLAKALLPEDVAAACLFVAALPSRARVPELQLVPADL